MKHTIKVTAAYALGASILAAAAVYAGETRRYVAANEALDDKAIAELCANSPARKAKLNKALHRMIDMGETPAAAQLSKQERRDRQFKIFWEEFTTEGG